MHRPQSCTVRSGKCGIFYLHPAQQFPSNLSLIGSSVTVTCHDLYAETKVRQVYYNDSGRDIEKAVYSFPLHNRAAVNAFEVQIDGVVTHGRVLEKQRAAQEFDNTVTAGGSAQLLEEESRDVFQMIIGGLKVWGELGLRRAAGLGSEFQSRHHQL